MSTIRHAFNPWDKEGLRKAWTVEMAMLDLELIGHNEMVLQLLHILEWVGLTDEQFAAVQKEIRYRSATIRRCHQLKFVLRRKLK